MTARRVWRWLLPVLFLGVPLLEIFVLVQVGQVIGAWWTLLMLVAASVFGAWLVRREGSRAWRALTGALQSGRMPARELADGALILVGGTLLLTPGFVTDAVGVLLVLPLSRPVARRLLSRLVSYRVVGATDAKRPGSAGGTVIRGEVVEE